MDLEQQVRDWLANGDEKAALTAAVRGLGPQVVRYLRSVLRNEDDAAEAFSRFSENVWKGLPSFEWRSSLRAWALRIAWHAALDVKDDAWRRRGQRLATSEASALADEVRRSSLLASEQRRTALEELRSELSTEEQSLLALRIDQALQWNEIAMVLARDGRPARPDALMKRFERLKARLARRASERGLLG